MRYQPRTARKKSMLRPEIALELKRRRPLHRVPVGHRARPVVLAAVLRDGNDLRCPSMDEDDAPLVLSAQSMTSSPGVVFLHNISPGRCSVT